MPTPDPSASDPAPESSGELQCSFCGQYPSRAGKLISSPLALEEDPARICLTCVGTSIALIRRGASPRYSRVIWLSTIGCATLYAAASFHPVILKIVQNSVPLAMHHPLVAVASMCVVGGIMGQFLALCVAPRAWLDSPDGRWWMRDVAGSTSHTWFRLWVARCLLILVLLTYLLLRAVIR